MLLTGFKDCKVLVNHKAQGFGGQGTPFARETSAVTCSGALLHQLHREGSALNLSDPVEGQAERT